MADGLPADRYLSLNASPSVVLTGRLVGVLARCERPIAVEVTGHEEARGVDLGPRSTSCAPPGTASPSTTAAPATPG